MADLAQKIAEQWADVFIKNSKATEAIQIAFIKGFKLAFPAWQKDMGKEMALTENIDEWPPGSDEEFLDYAEQHRERLGFPLEVDFGKLKEWWRNRPKNPSRESGEEKQGKN